MISTQLSPSPHSKSQSVKTRSVLVVDDHPVFRHGLCLFLEQLPEVVVCGEASNAQSALEHMRRLRPDIVIMDICMPGMNGIELVKHMLAEQPKLLILMLSSYDESLYALRALRAGSKGYVTKQQVMEQILEALKKIMDGGIYVSPEFREKLVFKAISGSTGDDASPVDKLSDREMEVLQLFGQGKTTREISETLRLSTKTVETHRSHIKEKLGFGSAEELMRFAVEWMTAKA